MKIQIEGIEELIPKDSYVNRQTYQSILHQYREAQQQFEELSKQVKSLLKAEKPREEWDELEQLMYDDFRIVPTFEDDEEVAQLKANLKKFEQLKDKLADKLQSLTREAAKTRRAERGVPIPEPTSRRTFEGFTTTKTGMSYYNDFLDPKELEYMQTHKGLTGYIAEVSPKEYLECCADIFNSTFENQIRATDTDAIKEYAQKMKDGVKFNLPVLNYAANTQEGRHRAQAAYLLGIKSIPVLVVVEV